METGTWIAIYMPINENRVAVATRKGTELVNAEFIQNIKILPGM